MRELSALMKVGDDNRRLRVQGDLPFFFPLLPLSNIAKVARKNQV